MPAINKSTVFMSGTLFWTRVLGAPVLNYNQDAREWSFEFQLEPKGIEILKKHKLADRIKGKGFNIGQKGQFAEREPFIQLKKSEFNRDGNPNTPIRVYDDDDVEWEQTKLIGNGSKADVKLDIRDYGVGKKSGVYPVAIRVTDHVAYQSSEFGRMDDENEEGEPAPKKKTGPKKDDFKEDFGLDDDIGF